MTLRLPAGFDHPTLVALRTGHHIRPIRETDVAIDYPAVMGSQPRLYDLRRAVGLAEARHVV